MGVSAEATHGEMKRRLAGIIGSDPDRYAASTGTERHKNLTVDELKAIARELGLDLDEESKQTVKDTIMLRLGRDHRTGAGMLDSSDLRAILEALEEGR